MATPSSNIVRVPKPGKDSFNPNRPLAGNTLLLNQLKHIRRRELEFPPSQQTGIDFESIKTEGQAAEYIRKLATALHPKTKKSGGR